MKKKSVAFWIFFILAVICIIYAVIVRSTGSGTSFFLMWIAIGIVLLLLGISFQMEFWKKVPHVVKVIGMVVVCIGIVSFVFVEGCVISQMHAHIGHEDCMEAVFLKGTVAEVRAFADKLIAEPGIRHGSINIIPAHVHRH